MQHLDEGTIHAWLDGELPLEERSAVEAHLASCEKCKAAVAEARGFIAASSRILTALDAVPGGVLPASDPPREKQRGAPARFVFPRAMRSRAWMAAAAVLVLSTAAVIAVRPRRETASLQVAAAPSVAAPPAEKAAAPSSPAPAPQAEGALAEATKKHEDKASADAAPARKDAATSAGAAEANLPAAPAPEASATRAADAKALRQEPSVAKLGSAIAMPAPPLLVSRHSEAVGADSIVTTLYTVNGVAVTLIDRSSTRDEAKRDTSMGFTDQVAAKSRIAAPLNSITWSDSAGRTHTLRGALSSADLERIKAQLFGATP